MRITKVTTHQGDYGMTLLGCTLQSKTTPEIALLGDLDELNVLLGNIDQQALQDDIFELSAAVYKGEDWKDAMDSLDELEIAIEAFNSKLEPLKEFIRPSGDIHLARAVCRRCERKAWGLDNTKNYCKFLNRLSDYLFVLARVTNTKETQWQR